MRRWMSTAWAAGCALKWDRGGRRVGGESSGGGSLGGAGLRRGSLAMLLLLVPMSAQARQAPAPADDTVAVVAFANITGAAEDEWIGFGIAETITADLAGLGTVAVVGNDAVQAALRGVRVDPGAAVDLSDTPAVQAGRALGARWVVSGGFQRLGQQVRLTARIVDVATAAVRHATTLDGVLADLFDLQDRLSADLRRGLSDPRPAMAANVPPTGVAPAPPMRRPESPADRLRPAPGMRPGSGPGGPPGGPGRGPLGGQARGPLGSAPPAGRPPFSPPPSPGAAPSASGRPRAGGRLPHHQRSPAADRPRDAGARCGGTGDDSRGAHRPVARRRRRPRRRRVRDSCSR